MGNCHKVLWPHERDPESELAPEARSNDSHAKHSAESRCGLECGDLSTLGLHAAWCGELNTKTTSELYYGDIS